MTPAYADFIGFSASGFYCYATSSAEGGFSIEMYKDIQHAHPSDRVKELDVMKREAADYKK